MKAEDKLRIEELIEVCREYQGQYLPGHHGSGSWATTYSNQFIEAVAEMYVLFAKGGSQKWTPLIGQ